MTMEELYIEMKCILKYFDLSFYEKEKVQVVMSNEQISFIYEDRAVSIGITQEEREDE